jgi:hypothetical protein
VSSLLGIFLGELSAVVLPASENNKMKKRPAMVVMLPGAAGVPNLIPAYDNRTIDLSDR